MTLSVKTSLVRKLTATLSVSLAVLFGSEITTHSASASEMVQSRFANVTLKLPNPDNLCPVKNFGIEKYTLEMHREAQQKAGNKFLGLWVDCVSLKQMRRGEIVSHFKEWVVVSAILFGKMRLEKTFPQLSNQNYLKMMLKSLGNLSFEELAKKVDKNLETIILKYLGDEQSLQIKKPVNLGVLGLTDSIHSGMIVNVAFGEKRITVSAVFSATLIKGVPINFFYYRPYKNKDTIKNLLSKAKIYSVKIVHSNTPWKPCPRTYKPTWDNCTGTRTFHSGSKYVGGWKKGKEHGEGTLTYADGEKYVGGFRDGLHHGEGTITHANGKTLEGIWENDKFKSARD